MCNVQIFLSLNAHSLGYVVVLVYKKKKMLVYIFSYSNVQTVNAKLSQLL